ncbi:MAG: VOC family protein, partial [Candidatus Latescibacteria bacterium]|nr:VOC family protein [Candidatus Latescibacterota bacterium]
MVKIKSLEHIAIAVRDTDAEAEWYRDILGFSI